MNTSVLKNGRSYLFWLSVVLGVVKMPCATAQSLIDPSSISQKMQWFEEARLGIFIHWGIYAVNGVDESWSFYNKKMSYGDYIKQLQGFTASKYDPEAWARLIKESGARYAVVTTKHHDGVALWPTKTGHLNVVEHTLAQRDLIAPFFQALDRHGIKKGAYYSLIDWSHPDYPAFLKDSARYSIADAPRRWQKFSKFFHQQVRELVEQYSPDLWWFDGDWEHSAEEWDAAGVRTSILNQNPKAIINGRLRGYGDYETPEQNFPVTRPAFRWWELCLTTNANWGYQPKDTAWKTPYELITIFADVISNGGNLLLDIGPKEDGTIPIEQVNLLKTLGAWNKKHSSAIFGTRAGIPQGHFYGPTTLSKDSTVLYLFIAGKMSGQLMLKGLQNRIEKISVVGSGEVLEHKVVGKISWSKVPGIVYIPVTEMVQDMYMTVLALQLDGPVQLYRGKGGL